MITDTMRNANTQKGQMEELRGKTLEEEKDLNRSVLLDFIKVYHFKAHYKSFVSSKTCFAISHNTNVHFIHIFFQNHFILFVLKCNIEILH